MSAAPSLPRCRDCGAAHRVGAERCWLCGAKIADEPLDAVVVPQIAADANTATFSLSSLFLVMTLVAVCLGVFAAAPGLGVALAIVATPALLRTVVVTSRRKARGAPSTPTQKLLTFMGSAGVVVLVLVSIGIAIFSACWVGCTSIDLASGGRSLHLGPVAEVISLFIYALAGFIVSILSLWLIARGKRWQGVCVLVSGAIASCVIYLINSMDRFGGNRAFVTGAAVALAWTGATVWLIWLMRDRNPKSGLK